jgi:hypothetical protein
MCGHKLKKKNKNISKWEMALIVIRSLKRDIFILAIVFLSLKDISEETCRQSVLCRTEFISTHWESVDSGN